VTVNAPSAPASRSLGDLSVRRIGFGAMRLPGDFEPAPGERPADRDNAVRVLRRAVELGVELIDTAAFYFSPVRSANELINTALGGHTGNLVIATKVGPGRDPSGAWYAASPEQLRGQVEENLRQLGRDQLDLVYLRRMRQPSIAEHFGALAALREAGLIRHLGVSNVNPAQLAEAQAIAPVVAVQNRYNLEVRVHDAVLAACTAQDIAFVPYYAISGEAREAGFPARPGLPLDETVRAVAAQHEASPAQIRLAWTLHQGPNVLAIPGTGSLAHLEENLAAGQIELSAQQLAALEAASRGQAETAA
jgi:aryl-alcohol dehydrogenase-like predicted oxidoreductase